MMPTDVLIVTIPGTPDKCLSPNAVRSERHWGPRYRATQDSRGNAYMAMIESGRIAEGKAFGVPLTLHAVIVWEKGRRAYDPDSAHGILKATIDGIADALEIDDKHITLATVQQDRDPEGRGFVRVAIEPAAKEQAA